MNTPQTPDYGEPWNEQTATMNKGVHWLNTEQFNRAVACVNAMAGRPDPAAAMARLAQLEWVPVKERMPEFDDANYFQDVEWSDGKDIWQDNYLLVPSLYNATHWRRITLP